MSDWEQAQGDFWDSALKGNSALRAALVRTVFTETAESFGAEAAGLAWDMDKFYDNINPVLLADMALDLDYPVQLLGIGISTHLAPRIIKYNGSFPRVLHPNLSILAGCMQSVNFSRVLLHDLLNCVHHIRISLLL